MLRSRRDPTAKSPWLWADLWLATYTLAQAVLFPATLFVKLRRHLKGYVGEFDLRRWAFDGPPVDSEGSGAVVFVGAGPGELIMMDRLVEEMRALRPELRVTICLRDLEAIDRLRNERPEQRFAVWPFDHVVPVARWIQVEKPELVVFVDRFRFPAFSCGLAAAGVRVALVNGRCRRRSSAMYRLSAPFYRWQVSAFDLLSMEDSASADAVRSLASPNSRIMAPGSLKADLAAVEPDLSPSLRRWLDSENGVPLIAAGSTRDLDEERMVIDAFLTLRQDHRCRLLLAPRNPERAAEVARLVEENGLQVGRRSEEEHADDVLLLDTFGELSVSYSAATSAYVGGFTGDGGGHNFMEPLRWGVPVAYGPNRGNFVSLQTFCEARGAAQRIHDAQDLANFWGRCLEDPGGREAIARRGRDIVEESRGAAAASARALLDLLPHRSVESAFREASPLVAADS